MRIGVCFHPNMETVLSLRPDLVIIQENPARLKEKFEALRLKVMELPHTSVNDIFASITEIGRVAGVEDRADGLCQKIRGKLSEIQSKAAERPRRRMMFIVGRTPGTIEGLIAVGSSSYLNELIAIGGGANVFEQASAPYPKVSLEEILARNPEVIVDMGDMAKTDGVTEEQKRNVARLWGRFPSLAAVKRKGVHGVASDIFVVPGPRMVDAALAFARMLHPEVAW